MRCVIVLGVIGVLEAGCATTALRESTLEQSRTLTDIHYQMVLDNLAMLKERNGALPWGVRVSQGSTTISDEVSGGIFFSWPPDSHSLSVTPSRQWQVGWTLTPVTTPQDLAALKTLYEGALKSATIQPDGTGWLHVGRAPFGAPTGHYGRTTVWVNPQKPFEMDGLTTLTMDVLGAMTNTQSTTIAIPGFRPTR